MKDISTSNFGLLIAYVLPGFVAIWGLSGIWPTDAGCMSVLGQCGLIPSLVSFLNTAIAAVAAGMAVSAVRFVVIDTIHGHTGLTRPQWNGAAHQQNREAVDAIVEHHYRYYQFHANMLIAGTVAYGVHLYVHHAIIGIPELLLALLGVVFWITARDNLRRY